MTCVAAWKSETGTITMSADSLGVGGYSIRERSDPKVFMVGEFLIGYTTSFRMGQLLRFKLSPPALTDADKADPYRYMCTRFIDHVRKIFEAGGYQRKKDNAEFGGVFLVAWRGELYYVDNDFQVGIPTDSYAAIGCGEDLAMGAMYALVASMAVVNGKEATATAIAAASKFSAGVGGKIVTLEVDNSE